MVDNYKKMISLNVKLASCAPLGFPFLKCFVRISHTFRILIHSIGMLVFPLLLALLALLARVNDKNAVDLQGITNMLAKTPIEELNNKIYRQISWHSKWSERDLSSCRKAVVVRSSVYKDKYWLISLFIKMFSNCRFYRRKWRWEWWAPKTDRIVFFTLRFYEKM